MDVPKQESTMRIDKELDRAILIERLRDMVPHLPRFVEHLALAKLRLLFQNVAQTDDLQQRAACFQLAQREYLLRIPVPPVVFSSGPAEVIWV
jgi:hypothetical protein